MSKAFVHENTGLGGKVLVFMPFLHEKHRSGGIPPAGLKGQRPWHKKISPTKMRSRHKNTKH